MPYTVTCRTADGVERIVEQNDANVCPIYHYDKEGKYYRNIVTEARQYDRGGPNYYIAPANSTPIAPPTREIGKVSVFDEETQEWSQVDDVSGQYWSTEPETLGQVVIIENPLGPLPTGITSIQPGFVTESQNLVWDCDVECWGSESKIQLSPEEKLANAGLTVDELKGLLGL